MSKTKEIKKLIVDEIVDTLVDNIIELTEHYMYEIGDYTESNDKFVKDHDSICNEVIIELYNRIKK
jgi:hypothetical protein